MIMKLRLLYQVESCSATMNKQSATKALLHFVNCVVPHAVNVLLTISICVCAFILCMYASMCVFACVRVCSRLGTGRLLTHFELSSFFIYSP